MTDSERTGAELFVETLEQYGVEHIFGNPGTTELPIVHATEDTDLDYILGLHEDIVTGMAGGYASTRRYHAHNAGGGMGNSDTLPLGVANLHLSAGLAHGLGNIYAAAVAGAPILVTAGIHSTDFRHEEPILSGDLVEMTDQFTKWSDEVRSVEAMPTMLRRAVRTALTPPTGPVFLALPLDQMLAETDAEPERLGSIPDGGRGDPEQVARAADLLSEGEDIAMVLGDGVARSGRDAVEDAIALAEAVGARVHGEILACEVNFPTDHDQWVSYIPPEEGLARTLMSADVLLQVGCSTNTTLTRHEGELIPSETTCVDISDDAWQVGKNQSADAAVIGDPGRVMSELADILARDLPDETREHRLESVAARREFVGAKMQEMGEGDATDDPRPSKADLVDAMEDVAGDSYIVDEGVTAKYAMLTRWSLEPDQYISNKGGGLGYGLPASIGAAIAEETQDEPRDVIGFIGDGSYLYYPQSIYSAVRHDVDLSVVIPDNRNYRILKDNTLSIMGGDEDDYDWVGMDFDPPIDIVKNAESHGASGHLVESPEEIASTIAEAVDSDGTDVVDVLVHD